MVPTVPTTPTRRLRVALASGAHTGVDDTDHGHRQQRAQGVEGGGRGGVARHHDELDVDLVDQPACDLHGEGPHLVEVARPVGIAARVADVDELLVGGEVDQRPSHGQPTEPAVEHADGAAVHGPEATAPAAGPRAPPRRDPTSDA